MLEIITEFETFGNWKDCYLYMREENIEEINVIKTRYCLQDIFGKHKYSIEQVRQMGYEDLRRDM